MRFFNTVGPRQVGEYGMVLPRFVAAALAAGRWKCTATASNRAASAMCAMWSGAAQHARHAGMRRPRASISATIGPIQIGDLAELVRRHAAAASPIVNVPYEQAFGAGFDDLRDRRPDLTRIREAVGLQGDDSAGTDDPRSRCRDWQRQRNVESATVGRMLMNAGSQSSIVKRRSPDNTLTALAQSLPAIAPTAAAGAQRRHRPIDLLNGYAHIFLAAFMVTLLATPLVHASSPSPSASSISRISTARRTSHPIPYLGGMAVFAGVLAAIAASYIPVEDVPLAFAPVPMAVVIGMVAITFTGLADDIWGWDPRLKIAGQLVAAAALAIENVGVNVAAGMLGPRSGR